MESTAAGIGVKHPLPLAGAGLYLKPLPKMERGGVFKGRPGGLRAADGGFISGPGNYRLGAHYLGGPLFLVWAPQATRMEARRPFGWARAGQPCSGS